MSFDSPEETRPFEGNKGQLDLVNINEGSGLADHTRCGDGYGEITMAHRAAGCGTE